MKFSLVALDAHLTRPRARSRLRGLQRFVVEIWYFGVKEARACLFAGLFFFSVMMVPGGGVLGVPRYDVLLIIALAIQGWMLWARLESWDEFKAILLFHAIGFVLEVFKTSDAIGSWSYPEFAYSKVLGVPLFSGFMYAAVASYMIQAWRLLDLRVLNHPPHWMAALIAILICANFFTHHFIGDYRWYLAACALGLYARSIVVFRPFDTNRRMPLLLAFVLIGFFIWIAENISTFLDLWKYPDKLGAWSVVHVQKWSSWSLLVIMTFTIVANLKHIKKTVLI
ncbi:MAG: DUF817 domain-containing protein [Pseudomonadota bacterium]